MPSLEKATPCGGVESRNEWRRRSSRAVDSTIHTGFRGTCGFGTEEPATICRLGKLANRDVAQSSSYGIGGLCLSKPKTVITWVQGGIHSPLASEATSRMLRQARQHLTRQVKHTQTLKRCSPISQASIEHRFARGEAPSSATEPTRPYRSPSRVPCPSRPLTTFAN